MFPMHIGIVFLIQNAFKRVGCKDFINQLVGMNFDDASVNISIHKGVGMLLKEKAPWIQVIQKFYGTTYEG